MEILTKYPAGLIPQGIQNLHFVPAGTFPLPVRG